MRAQRAILREIADRNLNPKVAYVAGKDGSLKEKKPSANTETSQMPVVEQVPLEQAEITKPVDVIENEKEAELSVEEVKPKKKFPAKKKETIQSPPTDE